MLDPLITVTQPMRFRVFQEDEQHPHASVLLDSAASFSTLARYQRNAAHWGEHLVYEPLPPETVELPVCPYCRARPQEWENDTDGPGPTGSCASPQCEAGRGLRHNAAA